MGHADFQFRDALRTSNVQPIRVVIADDHELVRAGLKALLCQHRDFEVVGQARDGMQLLHLLGLSEPDVVLCDIAMPGMDGLECVGRIHTEHPTVNVIVISMDDSPAAVRIARDRGAAGYVVKNAASEELCAAVRTVAAGGRYLSALLARKLLLEPKEDPGATLTQRQMEILGHIARGRSSREIGAALNLSSKTVDVHRARIMERLGVRDIAGLTRYAIRHRLVC